MKIAAEINFHGNKPPVGFVKACLDMGVKFKFGSVAQSLYEIGDFFIHFGVIIA